MLDRPLNLIPSTLKEGLHAAVREVSDPAPETELGCNIARKGAVENTLHSPLYYQMRPRKLHEAIITKRDPKGYESSFMKAVKSLIARGMLLCTRR